jgi:uncharacterized protein (TIGR02996 family)
MNERQAFLRAIEAEPQDDVPRLVYADWLEEYGEADRARFIRLQCRHLPEQEGEAAALLERHSAEWTAGLPGWAKNVKFVRGFPHFYSLTGKQFLEAAAAIRAVAPLDTLFLRLLEGRESAVFASEHLGGVRHLSVTEAQLTDEGIAILTASPHLGQLRRLSAARTTLGDSLSKDANRLTDASAIALAETDNLPALTDLELSGYRKITLTGIRALVESPRRAGLTGLNVAGGPGGPAVAELFRSPACRLTGLHGLILNDRKLEDTGAETLAGAANLCHLRLLWLTQNKIGDRGAGNLAASLHLSGLTNLDLWKNTLTDAGVRAILDSPHLRSLRRLELGDNPRITDAAARAILEDGRPWEHVGLNGPQVSQAMKDEVAARCRQFRSHNP